MLKNVMEKMKSNPNLPFQLAELAIKAGKIDGFAEIFDVAPKETFCEAAGITMEFLEEAMKDLSKFTFDHIFTLAEMMGTTETRAVNLLMVQWGKNRGQIKSRMGRTRKGEEFYKDNGNLV